MKVLNNEGELEDFKPKRIKNKILEETGLPEDKVKNITNSVVNYIHKNYKDTVSTSTIRSLINSGLIKRGLVEEEKKSRKLGMSVNDFEELLENGCNDNANIGYSPEMVAKYAYDSIAKEYALLTMPEDCSKAYIDGFIHIHDLEYYNLRPNCMNYDLRFFAKNGLKIDGKGDMGSVAKPAKSLEVLLNQMLQSWMSGASVFSGGQGYVNFNTLLAPFARGRTYKEIKQAIQGFIFNCNMSLICRGSQVLFSNLGLDLSMPEALKDKPAIGPGGVANGTYKDYQEEADLILRAVMEVSCEKDGEGAYHRFPNLLFHIRKGDLDKYEDNCKLLHEMGANNPTWYYVNCTELERTVMGCFSGETSLWCKINGELQYISFKELSKLFNADYGVTPVDDYNIEVLTIDDDRNVIWSKASNFIKNKDRKLYNIVLPSNKSFVCDDTHTMITVKGLNKKNIMECEGSNLIDVNCYDVNVDIDKMDYLGALYGFWLGDGLKAKDYGYIIVHKKDKLEYLKSLFDKLDIDYTLKEVYREDYAVKYNEPNYTDYKFIFDLDIFKDIDYEDINVLAGIFAGCMSSDGYVRKTGAFKESLGMEWVSTDHEYVNLFKYICFRLGITFSSRVIYNGSQLPFERVYLRCTDSLIHIVKQLVFRGKQQEVIDDFEEGVFRTIEPTKNITVKAIEPVGTGDTYCFEVNDRIIVGNDFILTGNCRTALPQNYTGDYEKDCMNTGNFMYNTLNLELMALESDGDVDKFYELLDYYCEITYKSLHDRKEKVSDVIYNKHMSDFLIQKDKDTGIPLYDLDRCSYTIGYCGLNEALEVLYGAGVIDNLDKGVEIVEYLNNKKDEFHSRDGWRWSVIGSPAESTAHRFGEINKKRYPDCPMQGKEGSWYVTNSHHIPVADKDDLVEHIKNAEAFHKLSMAGCLLHIWSGEVWSDPKAIWSLNKKILEHGVLFWAYSKVFTFCRMCGYTINTEVDKCPICGSEDLRVYDRCFSGDTVIYIKKDNIVKPVTLKDFVDNYNVKEWSVPVYDYKTNNYIWSKVKRGIHNPAESMITIKFNKGYEVTCTPNHNFYDYSSSNRKTTMYNTISANDLKVKSHIINHRCPTFLDENYEEDFLGTFIGFVLGDGNVMLQSNGVNIYIRFTFYKPEKSEYCKLLLEKNDLEYTYTKGIDSRNGSKTYTYYIGVKNIGNPAYDIFNETKGDKKAVIDKCYDEKLFIGILAGLINSDGSVLVESRKGNIVTTFNQVDKEILWLYYNIALLLGTNPSISFTQRKEGYETMGRVETSSRKMYNILKNIVLRSPFDENLKKGKCISDANNINGMCSVSSISEAPVQDSYCIETEHEGHNTLFNGVLAQNCTGYYLPRDTFNSGKLQEQKDRFRHKI